MNKMIYCEREVHLLRSIQIQQLCHFPIQDFVRPCDEHWHKQFQWDPVGYKNIKSVTCGIKDNVCCI